MSDLTPDFHDHEFSNAAWDELQGEMFPARAEPGSNGSFDEQVWAMLDGLMDRAAIEKLEEQLTADDEARRRYCEIVALDATLTQHFGPSNFPLSNDLSG